MAKGFIIAALLAILLVLLLIAFGTRNSAAESNSYGTEVSFRVYKIQDGDNTCYVYRGQGGISCLKESNAKVN
jgi:hypothetical protein